MGRRSNRCGRSSRCGCLGGVPRVASGQVRDGPASWTHRSISPDNVWRLCEVVDDVEGGLPRLKGRTAVFKHFGLPQSAAINRFAVRSS